jgi:hypothetical protein
MQVDKAGATHYFGIGTATYKGEHSSAVREAQQLGLELGSVSVSLEKGFHAHQDSALTRTGRGGNGAAGATASASLHARAWVTFCAVCLNNVRPP